MRICIQGAHGDNIKENMQSCEQPPKLFKHL